MVKKYLTDNDSDGAVFGQSSSDKIAFFGANPVARPSAPSAATTTALTTVATTANSTCATTAATNSSPYGFSQAQADAIVTAVNGHAAKLDLIIAALNTLAARGDSLTTISNTHRSNLVTLGLQG